AASAALYFGTRGDSGFQEEMLYKVVFAEILPSSPDPRGDLAVLGLDPAALRYVGTTPKAPNSPFRNPEVRASLFPRLSYRSLLRLYERRPARAAAELVRKAPAGLELRADFGNFEKEAGFRPGARSAAYSAWTRFRLLGRNRAALFLGLFFGANLLLAALLRIPASARVGLVALLATGALAYAVCTLASSPIDMSRKLYVFHAITDLLIAVDVALVGRALATRRLTAAGNGSSARL
ncbi:MAG TPA: hypothetical protein VFL12_11970, partial [Thermoanaerobaculia bacterium]|nr:hypothetical protein [Thermoanaerobaculia bacterium]